jgi:uncharacterized repeat protein (TIGR01451 family)
MQKAFLISLNILFILFCGLFSGSKLYGQSPNFQSIPAEQQVSFNQDGITINKLSTAGTIPSGVTFEYIVQYSLPPGLSNVKIRDVIPNTLDYLGFTHTLSSGVAPVLVNSPGGPFPLNAGTGTRQIELTWNNTGAAGVSGELHLQVQFPNEVTCDGAPADNRVCCIYTLPNNGDTKDFCDNPNQQPTVHTFATAVNPWQLNKSTPNAVSNPTGCGKQVYLGANGNFRIRYFLGISKNPAGSDIGQLNLNNVVVSDAIAPGGTLDVNSVQAFFASSNVAIPITNNSTTSQLNVGFPNLDVSDYNGHMLVEFWVDYPASAAGQTIDNVGTLTGTLGSTQGLDCGNATLTSPMTCVYLNDEPVGATFIKRVVTQRAPGCPVQYRLGVDNQFNSNSIEVGIEDQLPAFDNAGTGAGLIFTSPAPPPTANPNSTDINGSGYFNTNLMTPNTQQIAAFTSFTQFLFSTIDPGATPGRTISNTATFTDVNGNILAQPSADFEVAQHTIRMCTEKTVVDQKNCYAPGETVRFRLRFQNLGSASFNSLTISDLLNRNLNYVPGSFEYYSMENGVRTNLSGAFITGAPDALGNTPLSFDTDPVSGFCDNVYQPPFCGERPDNLTYFIEYKAIVSNAAGVGNVPNGFTVSSAAPALTVNSNIVYTNICRNNGFSVEKSVSTDGGVTFSGSADLTNASTPIRYRLQMTPAPGAYLYQGTMVDLLPHDNGPGSDWMIKDRTTARTPSGLILDLVYNSGLYSSVPAAQMECTASSAFGSNLLANASIATVDIPPYNTLSPFLETTAGASTNWYPLALGTDHKNLVFNFQDANPWASGFDASNPRNADFDVKIINAPLKGFACNTFVGNALFKVNNIQNNQPDFFAMCAQTESNPVCVKLENTTVNCCTDKTIDQMPGSGCNAQYHISSNGCDIKSIEVANISGGALVSVAQNSGCSAPSPISGTPSPGFIYGSGCSSVNSFEVNVSGSSAYTIVVTFTNGTTCTKVFNVECDSMPQCMIELESAACPPDSLGVTNTYVVTGILSNNSAIPATLTVDPVNGGTVSNLSPTSIPAHASGVTFTFTYTLPGSAEVPACFLITLFSPTVKCQETICVDLPECPPPSESDCCPHTTMTPCDCDNAPGNLVYQFTTSGFATPICGIIVTSNILGAGGSGVFVDHNAVSQGTVIPNGPMLPLNPDASQSLEFGIPIPLNSSGTITIRYILCGVNIPCEETFVITPAAQQPVELVETTTPNELYAFSFNLNAEDVVDDVKLGHISIKAGDDDSGDDALFFAITGSEHFFDPNKELMPFGQALQGKKSATFSLKRPISLKEISKDWKINIVTTRKVSSLNVSMFDENGAQISHNSVTPLQQPVVLQTRTPDEISNMRIKPNPASDLASVKFTVAHDQEITLDLLDNLGRIIRTLDKGPKTGGQSYEVSLALSDLDEGLYFVRLTAASGVYYTEKLVVMH